MTHRSVWLGTRPPENVNSGRPFSPGANHFVGVKRAGAAGYNAPLNAGYPPRRALACERGAARAPPWIIAVFCQIPLETIPLSLMLRRELQAENDCFQSSFFA
jgi:hypothetical protein